MYNQYWRQYAASLRAVVTLPTTPKVPRMGDFAVVAPTNPILEQSPHVIRYNPKNLLRFSYLCALSHRTKPKQPRSTESIVRKS